MITVTVGAQHKSFLVHEGILTQTSMYFKNQYSKRWGFPNLVGLPREDIEEQTFACYSGWLYDGNLDLSASNDLSDENDPQGSLRFCELFKLYILADCIRDTAFCNLIVDHVVELIKLIRHRPTPDAYRMTFERTAPNSKLCQLLVDDALSGTDPNWLEGQLDVFPKEFIDNLFVGWARASWDEGVVYEQIANGYGERCKYHEHDEVAIKGEACLEVPKVKEVEVKKAEVKKAAKKKSFRYLS